MIVLFSGTIDGQDKYKIVTIGFYNIENLFDTLDTPHKKDSEFLPSSAKKWNSKRYADHLKKISRVISEMGIKTDKDGIDILGISEVENRDVVIALTHQESIKDRHYQVIHGESPDERGIDVALIYNPRVFTPMGFELLYIPLEHSDGTPDYTRDILYVYGNLYSEKVHLFINHWPSRGGGQSASAHKRNKAAEICRKRIDSLLTSEPNAKILIMGDFNDDPISASITEYLRATGKKDSCENTGLYNTMWNKFKNGDGTLAYHDAWNLFDQIIISCPLLSDKQGFHLSSTHIFKKPYMLQKFGPFKGYPFRSFVGNNYMGGYSDHFPVYVHLIKKSTIK